MDLFEYFLVIPPLPLEVEVEVEVVSLLFDFLGIGNNFFNCDIVICSISSSPPIIVIRVCLSLVLVSLLGRTSLSIY